MHSYNAEVEDELLALYTELTNIGDILDALAKDIADVRSQLYDLDQEIRVLQRSVLGDGK